MKYWKNDNELFDLMRNELYTAVVGDAMDNIGYFHQFLSPLIRPLRDDMVVAGRSMTVLESDTIVEMKSGEAAKNPFGKMLEALDDLKENEVYLCAGSSSSYALLGELMSTRAKILGAAGAVVNGYSRDTKGILELNFPSFSYGRYSQDQAPRGAVIDYRCPLNIDGVKVNDGDIVFGDLDGVCIIPREIESQIIMAALDKARGEKCVAEAIKGGMSASASWDKYGIM